LPRQRRALHRIRTPYILRPQDRHPGRRRRPHLHPLRRLKYPTLMSPHQQPTPQGNPTSETAKLKIHRNPRLWDHPAEFDPDRFAAVHPPRDQFAYMPFGIGGRKCMGGDFAVFEATLAITMISQAFRVELVDPLAVKPLPQITFRPTAVPVRLVPV